jgi:hypothetical protein
MLDDSLDKENIKCEQEKDDFFVKQNPGAFSENCELFRDDSGVVYRRRPMIDTKPNCGTKNIN